MDSSHNIHGHKMFVPLLILTLLVQEEENFSSKLVSFYGHYLWSNLHSSWVNDEPVMILLFCELLYCC